MPIRTKAMSTMTPPTTPITITGAIYGLLALPAVFSPAAEIVARGAAVQPWRLGCRRALHPPGRRCYHGPAMPLRPAQGKPLRVRDFMSLVLERATQLLPDRKSVV